MPHMIIEYSQNITKTITTSSLLQSVHTGAQQSGLFAPTNIKSRLCAYDDYSLGEKDQNQGHFIHITAKILAGRTDDQKRHLGQSILTNLQKLSLPDCTVTIEVQDTRKEIYTKFVSDPELG